MDKIKNILSPGASKDDEIMYGNLERTKHNDPTDPTTGSSGLGSSSDNQSNLPIRDTTKSSTASDSNLGRDDAMVGGRGAGAANQDSKREHDTPGAGQTDGLADSRTGAQAAQDQSGSHGAGRDAGNASVVNRAHDNDPDKGETVYAGTTSQSKSHGDKGLTSGSSSAYSQPTTSSATGDATSGLTGSSATKTTGVEPTTAGSTSQSRSVGDNSLTSGSSTGYSQPATSSTAGVTGSSATKTAGVEPTTAGSSSTLGRDAGIAGGLVAGAGAGAAYGASRSHNESAASNTINAQPAGDATSGVTGSSATKTAGVEPTTAGTTSQSRPVGNSSLTSGSTTGDATSGLTGASATKTAGVEPTNTSTNSTLGRDAGIAGGLVAGAGSGAASESTASNTTSTQQIGERPHPLTSGTTHGHINPVGAPEASLRESAGQSGPSSHSGSSHTGVLGSSQHTTGVPSGGVHNDEGTTQLNQAPADVQAATFLDRSFYIGKPGDSVSHGPHVPGEFPAASGHALSSNTASQPSSTTAQGTTSSDHTSRNAALAGGAVGAGAIGAGAYASSRDQPSSAVGQTARSVEGAQDPAFAHYGRESSAPTSSTTSGLGSSTTTDHAHGRDAAVAGGVGALGAGGAYAATRGHTDPAYTSDLTNSSQQPVTSSQPTSALHSSSPRSDVAVTGVPATTRNLNTDTTRDDTHYGRNAAVVGGVGAAGAGAYAATRDHDENTTHSAYGNEDPNKHNKLHKQSPEDKKFEKEHAKEEKHLEKQHHAAEKQHDKDDKERRHAAEKAEKRHEKEEKEKKPSLIDRILHRHKDDKDDETTTSSSAEPLHIKENTENGPLDRPLVTAAGTTTTAGDSAGTSVAPAPYQSGGSAAPLHIKENTDNGPLDHPLVTAAGPTTKSANSAGSSVTPAPYQSGGTAAGPDWEAIKKSNA